MNIFSSVINFKSRESLPGGAKQAECTLHCSNAAFLLHELDITLRLHEQEAIDCSQTYKTKLRDFLQIVTDAIGVSLDFSIAICESCHQVIAHYNSLQ